MFRSVDVSDLSRVNLFTGMNGAGKTTLLEAVFLNCGGNSAGLANKLSLFRDDFDLVPFNDRLFKSLFHDLDAKKPVLIEISGDFRQKHARAKRSLKVSPIRPAVGKTPSTTETLPISGLEFDFRGPSGRRKGTLTWETVEGLYVSGGAPAQAAGLRISGKITPDLIHASFITPYFRGLWKQTHAQLTELAKRREVQTIVDRLKFIVPELRDLQPLSEDGVGVIYADLGRGNLFPATLLGAGFANVLRIVLNATHSKEAVLIIDGIEDGLHFSVLRDIVKFLFYISKEHNIQFFISTHSDEILSAFSEVSKETKFTKIAVYRLGRRKEKTYCTRFSRKEFLQASEIRAEIR